MADTFLAAIQQNLEIAGVAAPLAGGSRSGDWFFLSPASPPSPPGAPRPIATFSVPAALHPRSR
jgi:hypothetical protein